MPSLDVAFTEAELEEIRTASADASLTTYVHDKRSSPSSLSRLRRPRPS